MSTTPPKTCRVPLGLLCLLALPSHVSTFAQSYPSSAPAILQWYETTYETQINRMPDFFAAGYGSAWIPPTGKADSGGFSVGYDVFDRFNLGSPDDRTLYGTETGLRRLADSIHRTGNQLTVDLVWNHNGFSDVSNRGFVEAGGYPGFILENPDGGIDDGFGVPGTDGDFHSSFLGGVRQGRLSGLNDINHTTNFQLIRQPTEVGNPQNIPAGTFNNRPDPNNARFYPDIDAGPIRMVFNPLTGQADIPVYGFNRENPLAGDAVPENALGLLMRNAQWLVEDVGVDNFRLDATKHFDPFVLGFFDQAVYRANPRLQLDGSVQHVFSYGENLDGDRDFVLYGDDRIRGTNDDYLRKDINDADPGRIGGNRDALDFPQFFAIGANFTDNGFANDFRNVVNAGLDVHDDGIVNGSAGVTFVNSHDDFGPALSNVAHAFLLMRPGNSIVYHNAKQFGDGRDFPKDGRGDALGNFGDTITELVQIRNSHGRGEYFERWLTQNEYAYERDGSAVVLLSNRNDGGVSGESRIGVNLAAGTYLVELTGNHAADGLINEVLQVQQDANGTFVNARFLNNDGRDQGYLIYGLATPQSPNGIELSNVDSVLVGGDPDLGNGFERATARLADISVISSDSFEVKLETQAVNLLGVIRDPDADGDNALLKINGGLDVNGNGSVDNVTPGTVQYSFEEFLTEKVIGTRDGGDGNGLYRQLVDATLLPEGENYLEVLTFRRRTDGGPPVYSSFRETVYIDRLDPISGIRESVAVNTPGSGDRDVFIESLDFTADSVHVFLNLAEAVTDQEVLDLAFDGQGTTERRDLDLFKTFFGGLAEGNNVYTVVTFERTGTSNVQRFAGQLITDGRGIGFGDTNHDGAISKVDIANGDFGLERFIFSRDTLFNPAADLNGDGRNNVLDVLLYDEALAQQSAAQAVFDELAGVKQRRANINQEFGTDTFDIDAAFDRLGTDDWFADLDGSGLVEFNDIALLVEGLLGSAFGDSDLDRDIDRDDVNRALIRYTGELINGSQTYADGDTDGDGDTDVLDIDTILSGYLAQGGVLDAGLLGDVRNTLGDDFSRLTIPEPHSLMLLAVLSGLAGQRRRR
ncbi:MAG: hypothetical protein AAF797_01965 [Planctomycetota bacterium]